MSAPQKTPVIVAIKRQRGLVTIRVIDGGIVGTFRSEKAGLAFTARVMGDFEVQEELALDVGGKR